MKSDATTVEAYFNSLPEDRKPVLRVVRQVMLNHMPAGIEEGMQYGMVGYYVPFEVYPKGYHCDAKQPLPFAHLASQKNHMAIYLFCLYGSDGDDELRRRWQLTGRKLDAGKGCFRFKTLDDLPLDLIGETIAGIEVQRFIERYESMVKRR